MYFDHFWYPNTITAPYDCYATQCFCWGFWYSMATAFLSFSPELDATWFEHAIVYTSPDSWWAKKTVEVFWRNEKKSSILKDATCLTFGMSSHETNVRISCDLMFVLMSSLTLTRKYKPKGHLAALTMGVCPLPVFGGGFWVDTQQQIRNPYSQTYPKSGSISGHMMAAATQNTTPTALSTSDLALSARDQLKKKTSPPKIWHPTCFKQILLFLPTKNGWPWWSPTIFNPVTASCLTKFQRDR